MSEPEFYDLVEMAWVLLANVSEGDWTKQPQEWQDAVVKWRDEYHAHIEDFEKNSVELQAEGV